MARKTQEQDGVVWTPVAIPLGSAGLDLRRPDNPGTMSKLLNAHFLDATTVERRDGHTGRGVQDQGEFVMDKLVTGDWVYGHGSRIEVAGSSQQNAHHPIHVRGGGTFQFNDTEVVWTGDRMLVMAAEGPAYGASPHWGRSVSGTDVKWGIPAYLPVQEDSHPADAIEGDYMDTCLTETLRVVVAVGDEDRVVAVVTNRETGVVIYRGFIDGDDGAPIQIRAVNSGGFPCVFWRNSTALYQTSYSGLAWTTPEAIDAGVDAYDVATVPGGCHVVWRVDDELFAGQYSGQNQVETPHEFGIDLFIGDTVPNGDVACSVDPVGNIVVVWSSDDGGVVDDVPAVPMGLYGLVYTSELDVEDDTILALSTATVEGSSTWSGGLAVQFRKLCNDDGRYPYVVHAGLVDDSVYIIEAVQAAPGDFVSTIAQHDIRFNSTLATKSFRVGDEVFCWLRTVHSESHYLVAGVFKANICGWADREEALERAVEDDSLGIAGVNVDPLSDGSVLTWIRPFNAGVYTRPGNTRIGDINFLPALSTAAYGKSVYVAGSNVRNWDGKELGDAGFHDFASVTDDPADSSGSLTADGVYQMRIYPVRYNAVGERMQGVALTSEAVTLGTGEDLITTTITTIQSNHDDVVFECYRTIAGGTTFFLEGTVVNDQDEADVEFVFTMSDDDLQVRPADPHAPQVGGLVELEESAPLGCAILVAASDRLWGCGGQVGRGLAQFSKLFSVGEAAGFDAIAGTYIVDATGGEIVSMASFGDARVVMLQRDYHQVVMGDGPNNFVGDTGTFGVPQMVIADGAITHAGTVVIPGGIAFWGAGGPRVLGANFSVLNMSEPVQPLTDTMLPSAVRVDLAKKEVVWYTESGDAVCWNFANGSRWAQWSGLPVAGASRDNLVTTDGRLLTPARVDLDDGRRFVFTFATGNIRPDALLASHTLVRSVGFSGIFTGYHRARFKIYYNGSWLTACTDLMDLTPAEIDALGYQDHSGVYSTHKRLKREDCRYFMVEVSDGGDAGFIPWELAFELGQKPGLGRTAVNTFTE